MAGPGRGDGPGGTGVLSVGLGGGPAPGVRAMPDRRRWGWGVAGGYALALAGAAAAVALRQALVDPRDAQASSGMHAFGDLAWFLAVAALLSLAPTLLLLRAVRDSGRGLAAVARLFLAGSATAPLAVLAVTVASRRPAGPPGLLALASVLGFLRVLVSPAAFLATLLAAWVLAPTAAGRRLRWAAGLEAVGVIALGAWAAGVVLARLS